MFQKLPYEFHGFYDGSRERSDGWTQRRATEGVDDGFVGYGVTELIAPEQEKGARLEYIECGARTCDNFMAF